MTVNDVRKRVAAIKRARGDDETAHSMEDDLFREVLGAIGNGETDDPQGIALEALRSLELGFQRWCA